MPFPLNKEECLQLFGRVLLELSKRVETCAPEEALGDVADAPEGRKGIEEYSVQMCSFRP